MPSANPGLKPGLDGLGCRNAIGHGRHHAGMLTLGDFTHGVHTRKTGFGGTGVGVDEALHGSCQPQSIGKRSTRLPAIKHHDQVEWPSIDHALVRIDGIGPHMHLMRRKTVPELRLSPHCTCKNFDTPGTVIAGIKRIFKGVVTAPENSDRFTGKRLIDDCLPRPDQNARQCAYG